MKKDQHAVLKLEIGGWLSFVGMVFSLNVTKKEPSVIDPVSVFGW